MLTIYLSHKLLSACMQLYQHAHESSMHVLRLVVYLISGPAYRENR